MNCIIIDDEPLARDEMEAMIRDVSDLEISGSFSNAISAKVFLSQNDVDILFLDIEMPMVSGLEFARDLPKNILTIFTTAYPQYALESYELDAIDYLLKPFSKDRLEKAISKTKYYKTLLSADTEKNTVEGNTARFLVIKSDRKFYRINFENILYVEGLKDYVIIYTPSQKLITAMNLKTFHQKLPQDLFIRVSKSFIVNMNHIDSFDHNSIFIGKHDIPLGVVYKKDFFKSYAGGFLNSD